MIQNYEFLTLKFVVLKIDACASAKHKIILSWPYDILLSFFSFLYHEKSDFPKVIIYLLLDQLIAFIPGIAIDTPFRGLISAISHFDFLGFKPTKSKFFF